MNFRCLFSCSLNKVKTKRPHQFHFSLNTITFFLGIQFFSRREKKSRNLFIFGQVSNRFVRTVFSSSLSHSFLLFIYFILLTVFVLLSYISEWFLNCFQCFLKMCTSIYERNCEIVLNLIFDNNINQNESVEK